MSDAARAVLLAEDAVRRGWSVTIGDGDGTWTVLPVETADRDALARLDAIGPHLAALVISAGRAATLALANQREAAAPDRPVEIARPDWLGLDEARAVADPQLDLGTPLKGPFRSVPLRAPLASRAALRLARRAGILPAFFVTPASVGQDTLSADAILDAADAMGLHIVTRARLPLAGAEVAEIVGFRDAASRDEHVALLIGRPSGQAPLVRVHSECLTGDVFGSLKCDCGPQLAESVARMGADGWGILLYLRQEGRGIGLINKLRAYALQDQGFDTVDANLRLGFEVDARAFAVAARMLALLGQVSIRLLTNNPGKVDALRASGIDVVERIPLVLPANPYNERYLATKRDRTGHQL